MQVAIDRSRNYLPKKYSGNLRLLSPLERGKPPHQRKIKTPIIRLETSWDPESILEARDSHLRGNFQTSGLLWVWMLCTSRLKVALGKRTGALSAIPVTFSTTRDEKIATPEEKAIVSLWEKHFAQILPDALRQDLQRQAIGMGAALARVHWVDDGKHWWPTLTKWPDDAFYYNDSEMCWYARVREGADRKIKPGCGWVLWLPSGSNSFQLGAVASLGMECYLTTISKQDWANYNKANATAVKKAIVSRGMTRASKDLFLDQVEEVGEGENTTILCEQNIDKSGSDFEYVTTGDSAKADTFEKAKSDAEKTITIEILGQDKTTDLGQEGARSAVEALQGVEDRLVFGDGESLAEVIYTQLAKPWAEYNFGNCNLAPWSRWLPKDDNETLENAAKDKALADSAVALDNALQGTDMQLDKVKYFEQGGILMTSRPPSQAPVSSNEVNLFQSEGLIGALIEAAQKANAGIQVDLEEIFKRRGIPYKPAPVVPTVPTEQPAPEPVARGREPMFSSTPKQSTPPYYIIVKE